MGGVGFGNDEGQERSRAGGGRAKRNAKAARVEKKAMAEAAVRAYPATDAVTTFATYSGGKESDAARLCIGNTRDEAQSTDTVTQPLSTVIANLGCARTTEQVKKLTASLAASNAIKATHLKTGDEIERKLDAILTNPQFETTTSKNNNEKI
ncbi:hypothetical protein TRVL_06589 [Trypanosoma vivax]|nr:hypothetical protein TRVL_06589 [Trypanosoma vivax]